MNLQLKARSLNEGLLLGLTGRSWGSGRTLSVEGRAVGPFAHEPDDKRSWVDLLREPDLVEGFFDELSGRGHDSLLDKIEGTARFEIVDHDRTDQWLVTVRAGCPTVVRDGGEADWVMRCDRNEFNRIIHGDTGALAAVIRGSMAVTLEDFDQFNLLTRLFAGSPESRKEWIHDECWQRGHGE